jgi:hypothetical protein
MRSGPQEIDLDQINPGREILFALGEVLFVMLARFLVRGA